MGMANRSVGAVASCLILLAGTCLFAGDWPQWRGANRDGKVSGFTAPLSWPTSMAAKWKVTVGLGDASPALVGNKLYVFTRQQDDEVTLCLDADSGKELWRDKYPVGAITGPAAKAHSGPRSSPTVTDGKVVTLGVTGIVSCLDAATGKLLWRNDEFTKAAPKFFTATSPLVVDGLAVIQLGGEGDAAIVAFDLASGKIKWKWAGEGPGYSSPVVLTVDGAKQVVALTEKSVVGIDAKDGKGLWQIPFAAQGRSYNAATPIVDGSTVIFTGQGRGTKAVKIEKQGDSFAVKDLWSNDKMAVQFSTPVLADGLLLGMSDKGNLFCLNAKNGETCWTDPAKRGGGYAGMVDAGSVIFALPDNSELIAFKPTDKEYSELARIKVADTPTFAHPVIAGKNIYVKDQDSLTLWLLE